MVGVGKEHFTVHEDLICERSSFFKAACSKNWIENQAKEIGLPDQNSSTFKAYLTWAYSAKEDLAGLAQEVNENLDRSSRNWLCRRLCHIWILADYLGDARCKNQVIDTLMRENARVSFWTRNYAVVCRNVYQNTQPDSGLRKWLVDSLTLHITPEFLDRHSTDLPRELVTSMLKACIVERGHRPRHFSSHRLKELRPNLYYE